MEHIFQAVRKDPPTLWDLKILSKRAKIQISYIITMIWFPQKTKTPEFQQPILLKLGAIAPLTRDPNLKLNSEIHILQIFIIS